MVGSPTVTQLVPLPVTAHAPALIAAAGERASYRFLEFFAGQIRNQHSRRAYLRATGRFLAWLDAQGVPSIAAVTSLHVAAYVEDLIRRQSAPTGKQQLATIRRLFDGFKAEHGLRSLSAISSTRAALSWSAPSCSCTDRDCRCGRRTIGFPSARPHAGGNPAAHPGDGCGSRSSHRPGAPRARGSEPTARNPPHLTRNLSIVSARGSTPRPGPVGRWA